MVGCSLIFDASIKTSLLEYASTAMLFADKHVDSNVISWNRYINSVTCQWRVRVVWEGPRAGIRSGFLVSCAVVWSPGLCCYTDLPALARPACARDSRRSCPFDWLTGERQRVCRAASGGWAFTLQGGSAAVKVLLTAVDAGGVSDFRDSYPTGILLEINAHSLFSKVRLWRLRVPCAAVCGVSAHYCCRSRHCRLLFPLPLFLTSSLRLHPPDPFPFPLAPFVSPAVVFRVRQARHAPVPAHSRAGGGRGRAGLRAHWCVSRPTVERGVIGARGLGFGRLPVHVVVGGQTRWNR